MRGVGLMLGVDLVTDRDSREPDGRMGSAVTERCLELGLNVNIVKFAGLGSVLRIAPPLTITAEEIDLGVEIIDRRSRTAAEPPAGGAQRTARDTSDYPPCTPEPRSAAKVSYS